MILRSIISFRLSDEEMDNLRRLAKFRGTTMSELVREATSRMLEDKRSWVKTEIRNRSDKS